MEFRQEEEWNVPNNGNISASAFFGGYFNCTEVKIHYSPQAVDKNSQCKHLSPPPPLILKVLTSD